MNQELVRNTFQEMTPKPKKVLELLLDGKTDDEIAQTLDAQVSTVRKHIENICNLFEIERETIGGLKKNRREELVLLFGQYMPELVSDRFSDLIASSVVVAKDVNTAEKHEDWRDAPDVSVFFGRKKELNDLTQWIVEDKDVCRVVALLGMRGIGKTMLSAKIAQDIKDDFDKVIWRSIPKDLLLKDLLTDLIQFISGKFPKLPPIDEIPDSLDDDNQLDDEEIINYKNETYKYMKKYDEYITALLHCLRDSRCLLILNNWDQIMKSGDFAGEYELKHKPYGKFLKRLGEERHQSCLLLNSRDKPREVALLEGESLPVHTLALGGDDELSNEILKAKGLCPDEEAWKKLIDISRGNPLALKLLSSTIIESFGGDVAKFLGQDSLTGIFMDFQILVAENLEQLTELEKQIIFCLAINNEAVSLTELQECLPESLLDINFTTKESALNKAITSLGWRSLIEKEDSGSFSLQPVVRECFINIVVNGFCRDIRRFNLGAIQNKLNFINSYKITTYTDIGDSPHYKSYSILSLIKFKLLTSQTTGIDITKHIESLIKKITESQPGLGYAKENLSAILTELKKTLPSKL